MIYWAIIGIGAFVAIWMFFVVPAERRYHERKLELLQKRIEQRQVQNDPESSGSPDDPHSERGDS
jgi:hypothetical protein